ncbi:MAG: GNAT family N-acetyltransferase [Bacteroidota bacterium]|nr:GNAT family N-acetyltransferase [Bacteroidota bacterium]
MKNNIFLEGSNIYISPLSKNDISDEYVSWLNDEEICKENSHATFPNTKKKTADYIKSLENSKEEIAFAIKWKKNNKHIGNIAIKNIDRINRSAELAIIIGDKNYWSKGVGSDAYRMLIDYGFKTLNLNRISSGQTVSNTGMIMVCEKMGMKKEGILREVLFKKGEYVNAVIYSIILKDYKKINR